MNEMYEELIEEIMDNIGSLEDFHNLMLSKGYFYDIDIGGDDAVEVLYESMAGSDDKLISVCLRMFQTDETTQDYEGDTEYGFEDFMDDLDRLDWAAVEEHVILYYVNVFDEEGEVVWGHKDFGISDEELMRLSSR